jgi:hypothetical protein
MFVDLVLEPLVSPMQIAVEPRTILNILEYSPESAAILKLYITNILLEEAVGVILTDKPVISVKDVLVLEKVSVLVALTTCNTEPAGNLAALGTPLAKEAFCIVLTGIMVTP